MDNDNPNPIEKEWTKFCLSCFGDIEDQQYIDLRRTFYGGAAAFYGLVMRMLDPGDDPTEADLEKMKDLHNELVAFNDSVKAGEGINAISIASLLGKRS